MKKYIVIAVILTCIALTGACMAEETQKPAANTKQVLVDRNKDGKIDGVDIYDDSDKVVKRGYDTNGDGRVDVWERYDENTGMPIVTESDKSFELK